MRSLSARRTATCLAVLLLVSTLPAAAAPRLSMGFPWGLGFLASLWEEVAGSRERAWAPADAPKPAPPDRLFAKEGCLTDPGGTPGCANTVAPPPIFKEGCQTNPDGKPWCQ